MPEQASPAKRRLIDETAKRIRTAIAKRDAQLEPILADYDRALEHGSEEEISGLGVKLMLFASILDPVSPVLHEFSRMSQMLDRVEAGS